MTLAGAWIIDVEPAGDERGTFARTFCAAEYGAHGIDARISQRSGSWNERTHTLRGMHLRPEADGEGKTIRCTQGAVHDVLLDLRRESPTFRAWQAVELSAANRRAVFAPPGVAHGFLTLVDGSEVDYQMTVPHRDGVDLGVRWDDPAFGIVWPAAPVVISDRDAGFADFT